MFADENMNQQAVTGLSALMSLLITAVIAALPGITAGVIAWLKAKQGDAEQQIQIDNHANEIAKIKDKTGG